MGATPSIFPAHCSRQLSTAAKISMPASLARLQLPAASMSMPSLLMLSPKSIAVPKTKRKSVVDGLSSYESYCFIEEDVMDTFRHHDGIVRIRSKTWGWEEGRQACEEATEAYTSDISVSQQ